MLQEILCRIPLFIILFSTVMNITQAFFVEFILEYNFPCFCKILRYPLLDISTGTPIDIGPVN